MGKEEKTRTKWEVAPQLVLTAPSGFGKGISAPPTLTRTNSQHPSAPGARLLLERETVIRTVAVSHP